MFLGHVHLYLTRTRGAALPFRGWVHHRGVPNKPEVALWLVAASALPHPLAVSLVSVLAFRRVCFDGPTTAPPPVLNHSVVAVGTFAFSVDVNKPLGDHANPHQHVGLDHQVVSKVLGRGRTDLRRDRAVPFWWGVEAVAYRRCAVGIAGAESNMLQEPFDGRAAIIPPLGRAYV